MLPVGPVLPVGPTGPVGPERLPKSCSNVTGIAPGLSLHDLSALMSPIVSKEPFLSMQTAYFGVVSLEETVLAPVGPAATASPHQVRAIPSEPRTTTRVCPWG
jgi:hypothetical protein